MLRFLGHFFPFLQTCRDWSAIIGAHLSQKLMRDHAYNPNCCCKNMTGRVQNFFCPFLSTGRLNFWAKYSESNKQIKNPFPSRRYSLLDFTCSPISPLLFWACWPAFKNASNQWSQTAVYWCQVRFTIIVKVVLSSWILKKNMSSWLRRQGLNWSRFILEWGHIGYWINLLLFVDFH